MKSALTCWSLNLALGAIALTCIGCSGAKDVSSYAADESGHRLVRISFAGQKNTFRIRISQGPVEKVQNVYFTNIMARFNFKYGDIVVWEAVRDERGRELTWPGNISRWWITYLGQVRASHYCINSDNIKNFFSSPIYHWKASPTKPRPLKEAAFYRDGVYVGEGSSGIYAMLDSVQKQGNGDTPFVVAPRFKNGINEGSTDQVWAWLDEAGARARYEGKGWPGDIMDFARMMDDQ